MSEKRLSGEEKRRKMKEEFKEELRKRKEFLEKVRRLRHLRRINQALASMSPQDDTDEWIRKLNEETAFLEAQTELALEGAKVIDVPIEGPDDEIAEPETPKLSEDELRKMAAEELVRQMKEEMAQGAGDVEASEIAGEEEEPEEDQPENTGGGTDRPHRKMLKNLDED